MNDILTDHDIKVIKDQHVRCATHPNRCRVCLVRWPCEHADLVDRIERDTELLRRCCAVLNQRAAAISAVRTLLADLYAAGLNE